MILALFFHSALSTRRPAASANCNEGGEVYERDESKEFKEKRICERDNWVRRLNL